MRLRYFLPVIALLVLSVFFFMGLGRDPSVVPSPLIDKPVPAFSLPALAGRELQDKRGERHSLLLSGSDLLEHILATHMRIWRHFCSDFWGDFLTAEERRSRFEEMASKRQQKQGPESSQNLGLPEKEYYPILTELSYLSKSFQHFQT